MHKLTEEQRERAADIRLLLMDVDGVWTDGKLFYVPGGGEMVEVKAFNTEWWHKNLYQLVREVVQHKFH